MLKNTTNLLADPISTQKPSQLHLAIPYWPIGTSLPEEVLQNEKRNIIATDSMYNCLIEDVAPDEQTLTHSYSIPYLLTGQIFQLLGCGSIELSNQLIYQTIAGTILPNSFCTYKLGGQSM